jgi:hypothetical protein
MTGMIQDGVWDAFPKLKIGFLEAYSADPALPDV